MSENVKVSLYLPERMAQEVAALVESGYFTTKTDVHQEALRRLLLDYRALEEGGVTDG